MVADLTRQMSTDDFPNVVVGGLMDVSIFRQTSSTIPISLRM